MTQAVGRIAQISEHSLTRRDALIGLAAIAAPAAAGAACMAPAETDPILAAIERHRATFKARLVASQIYSETPTFGPDYDEATCDARNEADCERREQDEQAALALTTTRPTTREGVSALLAYVDAFNNRANQLPHMPNDWYSCAFVWPWVQQEDMDVFGHLIVANARRRCKR